MMQTPTGTIAQSRARVHADRSHMPTARRHAKKVLLAAEATVCGVSSISLRLRGIAPGQPVEIQYGYKWKGILGWAPRFVVKTVFLFRG